MKISKWLSVLCALAAGAAGLTVRADDNPAQAAARIALAKQLSELNAHPAMAQPGAMAGARPLDENQLAAQRAAQWAALAAAMPARPPVEMPAKIEKQVSPVAPAAKPAVMGTAPQPAPRPVAAAPQPAKPATANYDYAGKDLGMKPITAPALPITASKEDQLDALLMRYKADLISPAEYQKQRAAILAEP